MANWLKKGGKALLGGMGNTFSGIINWKKPHKHKSTKQRAEELQAYEQNRTASDVGLPEGMGSNYLDEQRPHGYSKFRSNNYTQAQNQQYNRLYGLVGPESSTYKTAMGDQSQFDEMEAPALRQFGALQGNLASKFSGAGMGARRSSGHQNSQNAAAQDFAGQLQANRQGLQRQAVQDLMGLSQQLLQSGPYTSGYAAKGAKEGIAGGYGGPTGTVLGTIGGSYYGQPAAGAAIGNATGGLFD